MADLGFTVVELLIACALVSILMAAMVKLFTVINSTYTTQNAAASVQQVVRTGIDIMTQNIRMAGFNPLQLAGVGIQADSSADSIHFSFDRNEDGFIDIENGTEDNYEIVRYFHHDNKLKRKIGAGNNMSIIDNVTDLTFTYFNGDNQEVPEEEVSEDFNAVKTVEVSMTVTEPAGRKQMVSRTYATRVMCRNLGL